MWFETERDAEIYIEDELLGELYVTHDVIWVNSFEGGYYPEEMPWDDGGYKIVSL